MQGSKSCFSTSPRRSCLPLSNPAAFFAPSLAGDVKTGNFEDDLAKVSGVDWVIEAVVENLRIKRELFARVDKHRRPGSIVSSNTSGSSLNTIKVMVDGGYSVEEVDAMTGPLIGRPKSASFRTADLVGLDTSLYVADNLYEAVPDD